MSETSARAKRLDDAKSVVMATVNAILVRRGLEEKLPKPPHLQFWTHINNALFDEAVLGWAKLFGSDDGERQPVHWKNVFDDHDDFRARLLQHLGVSKEDLRAYWTEMKTYRDRVVAHHDDARREIATNPVFDIALASAAFYYQEIVSAFERELGFKYEPKTLQAYLVEYPVHVRLVASEAVPGTLDIAEHVDTSDP